MKTFFKNRYFSFLMIYLCILCIFSTGLSLSQYTTNDTETDDSGVAIYDVVVTGGDPTQNSTDISMSVYATSKLSEAASMISGTYDKMQVNIINRSECRIALSNFLLKDKNSSLYEKIIIPMDKAEVEAYEQQCGSVPLMLIDFLGLTDTELSAMSAEEIGNIIALKNQETCDMLTVQAVELNDGQIKTLFIYSWIEHDNVYKADADLNADKISHKTPTELGIGVEEFNFSVYSQQVD